MEIDTICLHDLFSFNQIGIDEQGHAYGNFEACGVCPQLLNRLTARGANVPRDLFRRRIIAKTGSEKVKAL